MATWEQHTTKSNYLWNHCSRIHITLFWRLQDVLSIHLLYTDESSPMQTLEFRMQFIWLKASIHFVMKPFVPWPLLILRRWRALWWVWKEPLVTCSAGDINITETGMKFQWRWNPSHCPHFAHRAWVKLENVQKNKEIWFMRNQWKKLITWCGNGSSLQIQKWPLQCEA